MAATAVSEAAHPTEAESRPRRGVALYAGAAGATATGESSGDAEAAPRQDRSSILAGAADALCPAPSVAMRTRGEAEDAAPDAELTREEDDLEDDSVVYYTDSYRTWECHYLRRLGKQIHRLVCLELDRAEEALFMLFAAHDTNLDGVVAGDEATSLVEDVERWSPVDQDDSGLTEKDGSISFIALLKWYSSGLREGSTTFSVASLSVGLLGSGYIASDARLDGLDWAGLRANVVGYRRLYQQVRQHKEERRLERARQLESSADQVEDLLQEHYNALAIEFEGDAEHLFELFNEVDVSGNLLLELEEVEALLRLLDTSATERDLERYIAEMNLAGAPCSFASLLDWWEQARSVENSLVSEKGMALIASVKASSMSKSLTFSSDTAVRKKWLRAAEAGDEVLQALRDSYCRTIVEVREYKMVRDLRNAEVEAAKL